MNECTSSNASSPLIRSAGDEPNSDPLIDNFMNDFATKDVDYDKDKGKIFFLFTIGIVTLILVGIMFLTCLFYAWLRCRRRCNPYKRHCERKCQKYCRWFFTIMMLLLIPLILYLLVIDIIAVLRNADNESNTDNKKQRSLGSTLINEYNNFYENTFDTGDDVVLNSVQNVSSAGTDLEQECGAPSTRKAIRNVIKNMSMDIDDLCLETILWNDFGRIFLRNLTTFMTQTREGSTFYKTLNLTAKDAHWMPILPLLQISEKLRVIARIIDQMDNMYTVGNLNSKKIHENVKQILQPYVDEVKEDFSERGRTLTKLSKTLSDDGFRSGDSVNGEYESVPIWVLILEWICFVLIILIILILSLALIKRCCGKRWEGEQDPRRKSKFFSHEAASCLFELAIYLMCLLFLLALLPIWWNFEHGVGLYNDQCRKSNTERSSYAGTITKHRIEAPPIFRLERDDGGEERNNDTSNGRKNSFESLNEATSYNNECRNNQVDLFLASNVTDVNDRITPPNVSQLAETASNTSITEDDTKELKQNARIADEKMLKELCDNFKSRFHNSYLINLYDEINAFVSNQMVDTGKNEKRFSLCNLYVLKKYLIDEFDIQRVTSLRKRINEQCALIDTFFDGGFRSYTIRCLNEVQKIEKSYKENIYDILNDTTKRLQQHFAEGLENYKGFAINVLGKAELGAPSGNSECTTYTYDKNNVWIPLLMILLLFLPLVPIAIYLSRLYACSPMRPLQQSCNCVEARLYQDIKDGLYKRSDDFKERATKHLKPPRSCPCNKEIQTERQCRCSAPASEAMRTSEAQGISEANSNTEAPLVEDSPLFVASIESQTSEAIVVAEPSTQPCRRMKLKVKLKFITTQRP